MMPLRLRPLRYEALKLREIFIKQMARHGRCISTSHRAAMRRSSKPVFAPSGSRCRPIRPIPPASLEFPADAIPPSHI